MITKIKNWFKNKNKKKIDIRDVIQHRADLMRADLMMEYSTAPRYNCSFTEEHTCDINTIPSYRKKGIVKGDKSKKNYILVRDNPIKKPNKIFFSKDFTNEFIYKNNVENKTKFVIFSIKKKSKDKTILFFKIEENLIDNKFCFLIEKTEKTPYASITNELLNINKGKFKINFLSDNEFKITY